MAAAMMVPIQTRGNPANYGYLWLFIFTPNKYKTHEERKVVLVLIDTLNSNRCDISRCYFMLSVAYLVLRVILG